MNNAAGLIIALLVLGGGYLFINKDKEVMVKEDVMEKEVSVSDRPTTGEEVMVKDDEVMEKEGEDKMMKDGDVMEKHDGDSMEKEDAMMEKDGDVMEKEEVMIKEEPVATTPGSFRGYSASAVSAAEGDVVIGFFASWCPSCRALESDIDNSASDIPSDLTILKADYDSESALKKKYGVTSQHTLVQVDASGNKIALWRGGNTLESVITNLK